MFGTIICAADDSPEARAALRVGARLARALDAALVLVHVVEPLHAPGISAAPGAADELRRQEREEAGELLARLARDEGAPGGVDMRVESGGAVERLRELASQREQPLLAVGSRGRRAARSALLGSTSTALAARASCPVLVVPAAAGDAA